MRSGIEGSGGVWWLRCEALHRQHKTILVVKLFCCGTMKEMKSGSTVAPDFDAIRAEAVALARRAE